MAQEPQIVDIREVNTLTMTLTPAASQVSLGVRPKTAPAARQRAKTCIGLRPLHTGVFGYKLYYVEFWGYLSFGVLCGNHEFLKATYCKLYGGVIDTVRPEYVQPVACF